ncbi:MAG TPA: hypothetical protein ENI30_02170 [Gammaproteobacteria bacterium]|nr:hypothetical protein [Gammaproteobacteria bacterium]
MKDSVSAFRGRTSGNASSS